MAAPETVSLPTTRRASLARAVAVGLWLLVLAAVVALVRAVAAGPTGDKAHLLALGGAIVLAGLFVGGVALVREFSEAALTYTDDAVRTHAGTARTVRWARIAEIDPGGPRREVRLLLHGSTKPVELGGTRWLTDAERVHLVAELERRRRRATRRR